MAGVGKQKSLRKALGAIKDSTTVGLANLNSNYKELDIAIVKATNHVERPPKERHVQAIFSAVSAARPRADVAYCIRALARRLSKTHNWAVALKSLIVIHRALREVDPSFREELINYANRRSHILNLAHFKDDSSPYAWDYSAWVRTYALFLEERLECFHVLKYDIETQPSKTKELDTAGLLEQLPALQQLLYRLLSCQLQGAAARNFVIQLAFSMVANESIKIYNAISEGTVNLVDKFFEMQRHDAINALDIYRKMWQQVEKLNEFYDVCKRFDLSRGERFVKIEQPPESFLTAMEDYVKEAPRTSFARKDQVINNKIAGPKVVLALEYKSTPEEKVETKQDTPPSLETTKTEAPQHESSDLLGLNDPNPIASDLDEKNSLALAIVPSASSSTGFSSSEINQQNLTTGWELALVTASSSTDSATSASKLAGGMDKLTLDSLYDDALRRANQNVSYNPWEVGTMGTTITQAVVQDPFHASTTMAAPPSVQMAAMAQQQQAFLLQQQMVMMGQQQQQQPHNPFANPYVAGPYVYNPGMPVQAYNPHTGLI